MKKTDFFRFEKKDDDFPFYNDDKLAFTPLQSIFLMVVSIGSIIIFINQSNLIPSFLNPFINIIFPLGALMLVVKSNWKKLFRKVYFKDILLVIGVLILNIIVSGLVGALAMKFFGAVTNPAVHSIQNASTSDNILFFLKIIPMLFGEELITFIPFLVILQFSKRTLNLSRKQSVIIAWVASAIIFGAVHLSTYNWNFVQAIVFIGIARLILTFPYIKTKNILISFFVHVLNDWILFLPALLLTLK